MSGARLDDDDLDPRVNVARIAAFQEQSIKRLDDFHGRIQRIEASASGSIARIEQLEVARRIGAWILACAVTAAVGGLWTAYQSTQASGREDGRTQTRIEQLESTVRDLSHQFQVLLLQGKAP